VSKAKQKQNYAKRRKAKNKKRFLLFKLNGKSGKAKLK